MIQIFVYCVIVITVENGSIPLSQIKFSPQTMLQELSVHFPHHLFVFAACVRVYGGGGEIFCHLLLLCLPSKYCSKWKYLCLCKALLV